MFNNNKNNQYENKNEYKNNYWIKLNDNLSSNISKDKFNNIHQKLIKITKYTKKNITVYKYRDMEMIFDHKSKTKTCNQKSIIKKKEFNGGMFLIESIKNIPFSMFPIINNYHNIYHEKQQIFNLKNNETIILKQLVKDNNIIYNITIHIDNNNLNQFNTLINQFNLGLENI